MGRHRLQLLGTSYAARYAHNMTCTMSSSSNANQNGITAGSNQAAPPNTSNNNNSVSVATNQYISSPSVTNVQRKRRGDNYRITSATSVQAVKKTKVTNVYGTGPPRTSMITPVLVLRKSTASPADNKTLTTSTKTLRFEEGKKEEPEGEIKEPNRSFYPTPSTYKDTLVNDIITAHKEEKSHEYFLWDPRGWDEGLFENNPMPPTFCPHCRCPEDRCHVELFGRYCELKIVNALYNSTDDRMAMADVVEQLFINKYNIVLEIKITEETGQLDVKLNGYGLPLCIREQCLQTSLDYSKWYMYHRRMHKGIVVGREKPQHGHNKLFGDDM